jgi:hypothetical protein
MPRVQRYWQKSGSLYDYVSSITVRPELVEGRNDVQANAVEGTESIPGRPEEEQNTTQFVRDKIRSP